MLSDPATVLNAKVKRIIIRGNGDKALLTVGRYFRQINSNRFFAMPYDEFASEMAKFGITFNNDEKKVVFQQYDSDSKGTHVLVHSFLTGVRVHLDPKRQCRIQNAWESIPNSASGSTSLQTLYARFNAAAHPLVIRGAASVQDILKEFKSCFNERTNPDGLVPQIEFEEYYCAVSAQLESDEMFTLLLNNVWGLSPLKHTMNSTLSRIHHLDGSPKLPMERSLYDKEQNVRIFMAKSKTDDIIARISKHIRANLGGKTTEISRQFRAADRDRSGALSPEEWRSVMENVGVNLSEEELEALFLEFDSDGDGNVRFEEFLMFIRKDALSSRRKEIVRWAYDQFPKNRDGSINLEQLQSSFHAKHHPLIAHKKTTEEELRREFLDAFDCIDRDGRVTYNEFEEYYVGISQQIPNDRHFEVMMRTTWGPESDQRLTS